LMRIGRALTAGVRSHDSTAKADGRVK